MEKYIIGIDPGANGGLALLSEDGTLMESCPMPQTPFDILEKLRDWNLRGRCACYLEKVGGMPGQGGMAMFHFGQGYGHLEMALMALSIPTVTVTPQKWQKHFQMGTSSGYSKTEWKNKLKAKAQQLYPSVKVTLKIADALLIASYGLSQEK